MGVNLRDVIPHEELTFEELKGRVIGIDALNSLYQFLASIRQPDGTPLMDSKGNITSHLSGLFYRTGRLIELGIKPVYVFDGKPPELKKKELERRKELKEDALGKWKKAKEAGDLDEALKHAKRTSRFTDEMLEDSKKLLEHMGIPQIQAPSEAEAQCAHMCRKGDIWAVGSQDYDSLLFGSPTLVKGLTLSGKLELSIVHLKKVLEKMGVTREQLVDIAILIGTDFDEGVKGIGPKKALQMVKTGFSKNATGIEFEKIEGIFLKPDVTEKYKLQWKPPDKEKLLAFLSGEHNFSEDRVEKVSNNLLSAHKEFSQRGINEWF